MPVRQPPTSFTATRDLTIAGTNVSRGGEVTPAQAASLGSQLGPLVNRGALVPTPEQYVETERRQVAWDQKGPASRNPFYLNPKETQGLQ